MKCDECGQPMLKKGQRRKNPDDYRHASGCSKASAEAKMTAALLVTLATGLSGKSLDEMMNEADEWQAAFGERTKVEEV